MTWDAPHPGTEPAATQRENEVIEPPQDAEDAVAADAADSAAAAESSGADISDPPRYAEDAGVVDAADSGAADAPSEEPAVDPQDTDPQETDLSPEVTRIAAAVADLDDLGDQPVGEHVARYDAVHRELSEALASIDEV